MKPTPTDLDAIAYLAHRIRPDWDRQGIAAQLAKITDRPLEAIAVAAVYAAATRLDQRTPAILAKEGGHWRDFPKHEPTEQPPRFQTCPEHSKREPCPDCRASIPDPAVVATRAAAARAAIRPTNLKGTPT